MKSFTIAALTALLSTGALAVPMAGHAHHHAAHHANLHHKRDIVWITEFEVETVTVMKTVYGDGSEPTDSPDTLSAAETHAPVTFTSYAAQTSSAAPAPTTTTTTTTPTVAPAAYTPSTSTTQAPAPTTTTTASNYVAPAPTPETTTTTTQTYQVPSKAATQPTTATSSAAASPTGSYGGGSSGSCASTDATTFPTTSGSCATGDMTTYDPSIGMGSCGYPAYSTSSNVVAMNTFIMTPLNGANSNLNPLCGRKINLTGKNGQTYSATVVDTCPGCKGHAGLDLPIDLFNAVTSNADGVGYDITWTWA